MKNMKEIELAEQMVANLDWFKKQPDWQETVDKFRPMIEKIMGEDNCNALEAAIPILKIFKENDDQYGSAMLIAICTEMILDKN